MKIKIDPLDKLFSCFIRLRANGVCQRCGKYKTMDQLQCAHFHGRRKQSVRYDESNALGLCFYCHRMIDENPIDKTEFFRKILGETEYRKVNIRAEIPQRPDRIAIKMYLTEKIKQLNGE